MPDTAESFLADLDKPKAKAPDTAESFLADLDAPTKPDRSALDAYVLARGRGEDQNPNTAALSETLGSMPQAKPVRTYARPEDMNIPSVGDAFGVEAPRTSEQRAAMLTDPIVEKKNREIRAQAWVQRNRYALNNIAAGEALWGNRMNLDYFRDENGDLDPTKSYKFYDDIYKRHRKTFTTTEAIVARAGDTFAKTSTLGLWSAFGPITDADRAALANTPGVGGAVDIAAQTGAALAGSMAPMRALNLVPRAEASLVASGMAADRAAKVAPILANAWQGGATAFGERESVTDALAGAAEGGAFAAGATGISRRVAPMGAGTMRRVAGEGLGFGLTAEALALLHGEGIDPTRFITNFAAGGAMGAMGGSPLRAGDRARLEAQRVNDGYAKARGMESALAGGEIPGPIVPTPDYVQRVRPDDVPLPVTRADMARAEAEGRARREAARAERGPDDAPLDLSELSPRPYDAGPMGGEPRPPTPLMGEQTAPTGGPGMSPNAEGYRGKGSYEPDPLVPPREGPLTYQPEGSPNPMIRSTRPIGGEYGEAPALKGGQATPDAPVDPLLPRGALPQGTDADLAIWLAGADSTPVEGPPAASRPLGGAELGKAPTGVPGTPGAVAGTPAPRPSSGYLDTPVTTQNATSQQSALLDQAQAKLGGAKPSKAKMGPEAGATTPGDLAATVLNPRRVLAAAQDAQRYVTRKVGEGVASLLDLPRVAARLAQASDWLGFLPAPKEYRVRVSEAMGEEALARTDAEDAMRSLRIPKGSDPEVGARYLVGEATAAEVNAAYGEGWSDRADVFRKMRTDNSTTLEALDRDLSALGAIEPGTLLSPEAQAKYAGGEKYLVRQYEKILRDQAEMEGGAGGFATGGRRMPARHQRQDVSLERRMELGEIRDPAVLMAGTLAKQQTLIARAKFMRDTFNTPRFSKPKEWDLTNPEQPRLMDPGRGWVESQYSGKRWVRDYLAKDLEGTLGTKTGADKAARFIDGVTSTWKWLVAAGRPAALGRDMVSNFTMLPEMAGQSYLDPMNMVGDKRAIDILRAKPGTPEWALKRELIKHGLTDASSFEPDMLKMLDDVQAIEGATFADKFKSYLGSKADALKRGDLIHGIPGVDAAAKPLEAIAAFKRLQDTFIRARSVALRMNAGDSIGEAIHFTRQNYPWYGANVSSRLRGGGVYGALARAAGPVPAFANFLEWSARYWVKQALSQPLTVVGLVQGLKAITSYSQAANGVSDEQMADAAAVLKNYEQPGILRPMVGWNEETKSPRVLDLSMTIPFGNEAEALIGAITGQGEDDGSAKFLPMGPFGALLIQRMTNKSWLTGREIADPSMPASKQQEAFDKFLMYGLFPLARDITKFRAAIDEVPVDARGRHVPDKMIAALDAFAGVRYRAPDVPISRWYGLRDIASKIDDKLFAMKRIDNDKRISDADKIALHEELSAEIMSLYAKSIPMRAGPDRKIMPKAPNPQAAADLAGGMADKAKAASGGFTPTKGR